MKVEVTSITGIEEAIISMFMSKRTWTPELDREVRDKVSKVFDRYGNLQATNQDDINQVLNWLTSVLRFGKRHITLLRYIEIRIMTEGMHRAGQDDIDSHARRFENKIIRSSTRLSTFDSGEMSDWYKGKILTDGQACDILGISLPDAIDYDNHKWVKSTNGYVREEFANDKDVKRGLYMLSIPSNFVSGINLCEWAHVYKERNASGGANPEVKQWAEEVMKQITNKLPMVTRDYILEVQN